MSPGSLSVSPTGKGGKAFALATSSAAVPWEAEATWAGKTEGMTMKALAACASGKMWEVYEPTPLTKKFLVEEGFISK